MIVVTEKDPVKKQIERFEDQLKDMSKQDMKELLLIMNYKIALMRSQLESVTDILIKEKITTYEEIWKNTDDIFKNSGL